MSEIHDEDPSIHLWRAEELHTEPLLDSFGHYQKLMTIDERSSERYIKSLAVWLSSFFITVDAALSISCSLFPSQRAFHYRDGLMFKTAERV